MKQLLLVVLLLTTLFGTAASAQDQVIMVPQRVAGAPFTFDDNQDYFGQAYRWFHEGMIDSAGNMLKETIRAAGYTLDPTAYYIVVAHYYDDFAPIGMFHGDQSFLDTRLYGIENDNLYYVYVSRSNAESFVSTLSIRKNSPTEQNLLPFLSLFIPIVPPGASVRSYPAGGETWVDVRRYEVPEKHRRFSDISVLVKKDLSSEKIIAQNTFDNTAREKWSYGIATAITSVDDVDIIIGQDGTIIIDPKSNLDLATFAVVNYHFRAVDTKAKSFGNSFHLIAGIRLIDYVEPIVGIGGSVDLGIIDLGIFAGYSVEFADELEEGFAIGDKPDSEVDPFKLKLRGKPRFGLQVKFP